MGHGRSAVKVCRLAHSLIFVIELLKAADQQLRSLQCAAAAAARIAVRAHEVNTQADSSNNTQWASAIAAVHCSCQNVCEPSGMRPSKETKLLTASAARSPAVPTNSMAPTVSHRWFAT